MENELIFSTVHGSHLYGLAHADSDDDVYYVTEGKGKTLYQRVDGFDDYVIGTLDAFLHRAYTGSHQSVEALFSNEKQWGIGMEEKYGAFMNSIRIRGSEVFAKYERTIRKFCFGAYKRRVHAARLACNLRDLRECGRFDPMLTDMEAALCKGYAAAYEGEKLWHAIR